MYYLLLPPLAIRLGQHGLAQHWRWVGALLLPAGTMVAGPSQQTPTNGIGRGY